MMETLNSSNLISFQRRFRFNGGELKRFRIRNIGETHAQGQIILSAFDEKQKQVARIKIKISRLEEYRFQRRLGKNLVRLKNVRFGIFDGYIYIDLDSYATEVPTQMEFRASDWFIAGDDVTWEIVKKKES